MSRVASVLVLLSVLFLSSPRVVHGTTACCPRVCGRVGWWPANGTADDSLGVVDGTLVNGASFAVGRDGHAFSFDGIDDRVDLGSAPLIGDSSDAFTVSLWVNLESPPASGHHVFFIRLRHETQFIWGLTNDCLRPGSFTGPTFRGNQHQWWHPVSLSTFVGRWVHLAAIYTGGDKELATSYKVFVDGQLLPPEEAIDEGPVGGFSNDNGLGCDPTSSPYPDMLQGRIDDVQIFNRELSAAEIASLRPPMACEGQLTVDVVARSAFRPGREQRISIVYWNHQSVDAVAIPLIISGLPATASWRITSPLAQPISLPNQEPADFAAMPMSYQSSNGTISIPLIIQHLPPNASGSISLHVTPNQLTPFSLSVRPGPSLFGAVESDAGFICLKDLFLTLFEDCLSLGDCIDCGHGVYGAFLDISGAMKNADPDDGQIPFLWQATHTTLGYANTAFACLQCGGASIPGAQILAAVQCGMGLTEWGFSCAEAYRVFASKGFFSVVAADPNEKDGPDGFGAERYVNEAAPVSYSVYFENQESASAPAQDVSIEDSLDVSVLDPRSFQFTGFAFGDHELTPPSGSKQFSATVDIHDSLRVDIAAAADTLSGVVKVEFRSIDPRTGLTPEDPFTGFLPPNVIPPEGDGRVSFEVSPRSGLPAETLVRNRASVVFDLNAPVMTPDWTNTLDGIAPTSQVGSLPSLSPPAILVDWSGADGGSGVMDYTIYVSDDEGPFGAWRTNTTAEADTFVGEDGHSYGFYSVARDSAGNSEDHPESPDAETLVSEGTGIEVVGKPQRLSFSSTTQNPSTDLEIGFFLPSSTPATIELYDVAGRLVKSVSLRGWEAGPHVVRLDAEKRLPSGVYFVRLSQSGEARSRKVLVVK